LEGSKGYMKDLCAKYGVPTAGYARFTDLAAAKAHVRETGAPIVIKTDGLAAGKGVTVATTLEEAEAALDEAMEGGKFGAAGEEVVIEEYMEGEEVSVFALVDGERALLLASAQDHKRAFEGDEGPNTGGMGAYSPAPIFDEALADQVMQDIIQPTVAGLAAEGRPYKGVLFAGLMVRDGKPRLVEFNVRFGDPECQVLMRRLQSDIVPALIAAANGNLSQVSLRWQDDHAMIVVMAAQGYPGSYEKGSVIKGVEAAEADDAVVVFHAGTKAGDGGRLLANGGRVLGVTATGADLAEAKERCYAAVAAIDWPEGFYRRDIGWRALD
jgi:phosphoribosylamine--glycine ligase